MIINTGQRTDIPAFYPRWLANRLQEGLVCVRNPYNHRQVSRYRLSPDVVDVISFCTKNPKPMEPYMDLLKPYGQYWQVTLTPYGRDIEPNVPPIDEAIISIKQLSHRLGKQSVAWRYDPIFLTDTYTEAYHRKMFAYMADQLAGYVDRVIISFIDLYVKVRRNFPQVKAVPLDVELRLGKVLIKIAQDCGMVLTPCGEGQLLASYGADCSGCLTIGTYERALGKKLIVPAFKPSRPICACYLSCDIGAYDTCRHFCRYCYANTSRQVVLDNRIKHDDQSPFLIGGYEPNDIIHDVHQVSWIDINQSLF